MKDEPPHTKFQTSPLRKGLVNSARGAGKFRSDAIAATRRAGIKTVICARLNSAFYNHSVIAAILAAPGPRPRHRRTSHRRAERLCHGAFPSASFSANGAWLACAVIAYLTRTALLNIPPGSPTPPAPTPCTCPSTAAEKRRS